MCKRPKLYYTDMQEGISCYILNLFVPTYMRMCESEIGKDSPCFSFFIYYIKVVPPESYTDFHF